MDNNLIASSTINIQSAADKLWSVLTNSNKIKEYLFFKKAIG